jgi:hypothetical protein
VNSKTLRGTEVEQAVANSIAPWGRAGNRERLGTRDRRSESGQVVCPQNSLDLTVLIQSQFLEPVKEIWHYHVEILQLCNDFVE